MFFSSRARLATLVAFLLVVPAGASMPATAGPPAGQVKVDAVFTDYPENLDQTPWDISRLMVRASEPDRGFLRVDNPFKDWKFVDALDPADFGLDPGTDMKKYFRDMLKESWLDVGLVCVNVIDNRAVIGGQVVAAGDSILGEIFLGTWVGLELFDMDAYGEPDFYEDLRYDPDTGLGPTEADVRAWCDAGDVPVPPDWFYYQRELLAGGITVSSR